MDNPEIIAGIVWSVVVLLGAALAGVEMYLLRQAARMLREIQAEKAGQVEPVIDTYSEPKPAGSVSFEYKVGDE
jgi:hypothetical protein